MGVWNHRQWNYFAVDLFTVITASLELDPRNERKNERLYRYDRGGVKFCRYRGRRIVCGVISDRGGVGVRGATTEQVEKLKFLRVGYVTNFFDLIWCMWKLRNNVESHRKAGSLSRLNEMGLPIQIPWRRTFWGVQGTEWESKKKGGGRGNHFVLEMGRWALQLKKEIVDSLTIIWQTKKEWKR